jgi:uncharacterized protein YbaP (TraB family)
MEEYEMQKQALADPPGNPSLQTRYRQQADRLLRARDAFIADRIAATLQEGETGLLFLGALHRLDGLRSGDIAVETLL